MTAPCSKTASRASSPAASPPPCPPPKSPQGIDSNRPALLPHAPSPPASSTTSTRRRPRSPPRVSRSSAPSASSATTMSPPSTRSRRGSPSRPACSRAAAPRAKPPTPGERVFNQGRPHAENSFRASVRRGKAPLTLHSLVPAARHLAGIPGRKILIFMSGGFPLSSLPGNTTTPTVIMPETGGIRVNNMPSPERAQVSGAVPRCPRKHPNTFNGAGVAIYGVDVNAPVVPMMRAETDRPSNLDNIALDRYSPAPRAPAASPRCAPITPAAPDTPTRSPTTPPTPASTASSARPR